MTDTNNPPAFPHVNPSFDDNWNKERQIDGMQLRDYFAAAALQALLTRCSISDPREAANSAYTYASAMLAERQS